MVLTMSLTYNQEQDITNLIEQAREGELHPLSIFFSIGHGLEQKEAQQYRLDILKY